MWWIIRFCTWISGGLPVRAQAKMEQKMGRASWTSSCAGVPDNSAGSHRSSVNGHWTTMKGPNTVSALFTLWPVPLASKINPSAWHPADVTLVTSAVMKRELAANKCTEERIQVWQRGVDTSVFHPKFRSADCASQAKPVLQQCRKFAKSLPFWPELLMLQRLHTPCQARFPAYQQLRQHFELPGSGACSLLQAASGRSQKGCSLLYLLF